MFDPLTEEQRTAVESNIGLAYFYYKKFRKPSGVDPDDWMQECLICLCSAVVQHDPEKGKLGTLMKWLVWNKHTELKREQAKVSRFVPQSQIGEEDSKSDENVRLSNPDTSLDHRELLRFVLDAFPSDMADPILDMAESKSYDLDGIDKLNLIRSGFGCKGSVCLCGNCGELLTRTPDRRNAKYCKPCSVSVFRAINNESSKEYRLRQKVS